MRSGPGVPFVVAARASIAGIASAVVTAPASITFRSLIPVRALTAWKVLRVDARGEDSHTRARILLGDGSQAHDREVPARAVGGAVRRRRARPSPRRVRRHPH